MSLILKKIILINIKLNNATIIKEDFASFINVVILLLGSMKFEKVHNNSTPTFLKNHYKIYKYKIKKKN